MAPTAERILDAVHRYDRFPEPCTWACMHQKYDQLKLNLLWLICAEIDKLHAVEWAGNFYTKDIDEKMSASLRQLLKLSPLIFMRGFLTLEANRVTVGWRPDWKAVMQRRAQEAHGRLFEDANLVKVDFKNRIVVA